MPHSGDVVRKRFKWDTTEPPGPDGGDLVAPDEFVHQAASNAQAVGGLLHGEQQPVVGADGEVDDVRGSNRCVRRVVGASRCSVVAATGLRADMTSLHRESVPE